MKRIRILDCELHEDRREKFYKRRKGCIISAIVKGILEIIVVYAIIYFLKRNYLLTPNYAYLVQIISVIAIFVGNALGAIHAIEYFVRIEKQYSGWMNAAESAKQLSKVS